MKEGQEGHLLCRICPRIYDELSCVRCLLGYRVRPDYVEGRRLVARSHLPQDNRELLGWNHGRPLNWLRSDVEPFRPNAEYYLYFLLLCGMWSPESSPEEDLDSAESLIPPVFEKA